MLSVEQVHFGGMLFAVVVGSSCSLVQTAALGLGSPFHALWGTAIPSPPAFLSSQLHSVLSGSHLFTFIFFHGKIIIVMKHFMNPQLVAPMPT